MKNDNIDFQTDDFNSDPEENLRIENEILHLKLKAELGGELISTETLSPDLENTFLKNVLEFERAFANSQQVKIIDFLGRPSFRKAHDLADHEMESALEYVCALMREKSIVIDFSGNYDLRLKYSFITEELFEYETDIIHIPGMITHYIYEEFHPSHELDIEARATDFLTGWFNQKLNDHCWELANNFILPNKTVLSKNEVLTKIQRVFDAYTAFLEAEYTIEEINFVLRENELGSGICKGRLSYKAILENGEKIEMDGSFTLYLSMEDQWWNIFYFDLPGFKWE